MSQYTRDGGVIPSGIPRSKRESSYRNKFGLFKGQVVDVIYPENESNTNGYRVEYVVRVNGQKYPNAVDVRTHGGIYNYEETIRKKIEFSFTGEIDDKTYDEELDGEFVYVMFLNGNGDLPIIVGSAEHPRKPEYNLSDESVGIQKIEEFNGVEFKIDNDSNYTITHMGKKMPDGKIENEPAVGTKLQVHSNGDYEVFINEEVSTFYNKEAKSIVTKAQENIVTMDDTGINITDKNSNSIVMDASGIVVTDANGHTITMNSSGVTVNSSGTVDVVASGKMTLTASAIDVNGSMSGITTANSHQNVIDFITGVPVTPSPTVKSDV